MIDDHLWSETSRLGKTLEDLYADQRALARILSETDAKIEVAKANYKVAFDALQESQHDQRLKSSNLGQQMIDAGRGHERPSETRGKSDPLSQKVNAQSDKWNGIVEEMRRREEVAWFS